MADERQLKILRERGVKGWNRWRKKGATKTEHEEAEPSKIGVAGPQVMGGNPSFKDVDLSHAELRGSDLQGVNFQRANLQGANLQKANLTWSKSSECRHPGG